jgi:hypothetical protein
MNALYTPATTPTRWRPPDQGRRRRFEELRVTDAINIDQFLRAQGFDSAEAQRRGREALERGGLTRAGKEAFVASKRAAAERLLSAAFLRACSDACRRIDREGEGRAREMITVAKPSCEVCRGSNNVRAAISCVRVLRRKGIERVVLVGGTPNQHAEMKEFFGGTGVELRYVDGTQAGHSAKDALANRRWAQLIIVWGPTPLRHAVSDLYSSDPPPNLRIVNVSRRGIEALCSEVERSFT